MLHCAVCLAILLRHKLHAKFKSRNIIVATTIARSRIRFYFLQQLRQRCNAFRALHSVTSLLQLVSQCLCTEWLPIGFWLTIWRQTLALAVFILFLIMIIASCTEHIDWCNIPCNAVLKSFLPTLRDKFRDKLLKLSDVELMVEQSNTNMNVELSRDRP